MKTTHFPAQVTTQFEIAAFDLKDLGNGNNRNIPCKVQGFWSRDVLSIYVAPKFSRGLNTEFDLTISVSSGGRDSKQVASDSEAYANYAAALSALSATAKYIENNTHILIEAYVEQLAVYKAEAAAKAAAKQAQVDADPALGELAAIDMLNKGIAKLEASNIRGSKQSIVRMFRRGETEYPVLLQCSIGYDGRKTFAALGQALSKAKAFELLANCSIRSTLDIG